jgi:anti-anti-sigma regulatory factor
MDMRSVANLICDSPSPRIRVVRFIRPDLKPHLDEQKDITDCFLYQELNATALANLAEGDTLVINFGLIDPFPTSFYRLLLKVREAVQARNAQLRLCCFTPNVQECFEIMGGARLFRVGTTEASAVFDAKKRDRRRLKQRAARRRR